MDMEITTKTVLFLFLLRLEAAIAEMREPRFVFLPFFFECPASAYRTASTGETLAAILPGLFVLKNTVMRANKRAPIKIIGLAVVVNCAPLAKVWFKITGTREQPTK